MAVLLHIALFSMLGILQGSCNDFDDRGLEFGTTVNNLECYNRVYTLIEDYPKYSSYMNNDEDRKYQAISNIQRVIALRNKRECGKEYDDVEEFKTAFERVINGLEYFAAVNEVNVLQTMINVTLEATFAVNELSCCCKSDSGVEKQEYPTAKYTGSIKECTPDNCTDELDNFMSLAPGYVETLATLSLLWDQCNDDYEELVNAKETIPKGEKCDKETASDLIQMVQNVNLCLTKLTSGQAVAQGDQTIQITRAAVSTLQQLQKCSKGKLSK